MTENAALAKLREPFPPEQINKIPKGGVTLDYVGHAWVTARLLDVDPGWTWEPVSFEADGQPCVVRDNNGAPVGLWIRLTVCGVTRYGYGSSNPKPDAIKELIGDALRNAAMRFGVALDLWKKDDAESAQSLPVALPPRPAPDGWEEMRADLTRLKDAGLLDAWLETTGYPKMNPDIWGKLTEENRRQALSASLDLLADIVPA